MKSTSKRSKLLPEKPLLVYPGLAATIGLEEATLLSGLSDYIEHLESHLSQGFYWYTLKSTELCDLFPFWQARDIQRISNQLRELGILIIASAPLVESAELKFAFNDSVKTHTPHVSNNTAAYSRGMTTIAMNWQPDSETLKLIAQRNIPENFAREQLPEFVNYWRERAEPAHAWGSKFMKHVLHKWRNFETKQHFQKGKGPMPRDWRPSQDAIEVLTQHTGVSLEFIEDAIPEFELYWREQGSQSDNWNKKFRDHVYRQWERYKSALEHDPTPKLIPDNWQPSNDVFEVLQLANIDIAFARSLVKEFVIYWRDTKQVNNSWNTRFLQYAKKQWVTRSSNQNQTVNTRDLSLNEQLNDRSWAN